MSGPDRDGDDYFDLGSFHRPVTTASPDAQLWVDRGLVWTSGFNHDEAAKCFERAAAYDPACAIAYWGISYAVGPNYNKPWELFSRKEQEATVLKSHRAVEKAATLAETVTPVERALINALRHRYPSEHAPSKKDAAGWNRQYADAMATVYEQFPEDLDVTTLYADAMMNLTPWQLWDVKTGEVPEGSRTIEIKRVLEHGMSLPYGMKHPGVLHLYIHLMEMSKTPEVAMLAADGLRNLVPDAGHLNHMPSHLDVLVGDYANAVIANTNAIRADDKFFSRQGPMTFYTLYRCHDYHFRLYSAMFSAQSQIALETVTMLEATITDEILRIETPPMADWLESFLAMRVHALIRFGRWKDLIALKLPEDRELYCVTTALTFYAKGVAFAALGKIDEANHQRSLFREAVPRVKPTRTLFNNKCVDILGVAAALLDGEIEYRAANYDAAFANLRESIRRYDELPFDEPWGWMQPPRHAYGALLLEQGHVAEALAVYSADLGVDESLPRTHRHPKNVWSLHGYHECLVKLGRMVEAREVEPLLKTALEVADVSITSSCFCRMAASKI